MNVRINYPKPDLMLIAERYNKNMQASVKNRDIIDGLRSNRLPYKVLDPEQRSISRNSVYSDRIRCQMMSQSMQDKREAGHPVKFDIGIQMEEVDRMLIQKKLVIYYKRIKSN